MNMFLRELKAYKRYTILWTISLVAVIVIFMSFYPSISKEAENFNKLIVGFPKEARRALGLSLNTITSILGYYSYTFLYITLFGSIQAINLGISIISKETREKTAEFLLTKPVTRKNIFTSKLLAAVLLLSITNIIYIIISIIIMNEIKTSEFSYEIFLKISITLYFVQLIFLSLGILIAVLLNKIRSVLTISLSTICIFFVISMIGGTTEDKVIRYITPFKYFDTTYIITNSSYELEFIILSLIFIMLTILSSCLIYSKKEVHAV